MDDGEERLVRLPDGSAADLLDLPVIELIVRTANLNAKARAVRDAIIADVVCSIEHERTSSVLPIDRMSALNVYLEGEIAQRLRGHSALFWLSLYREIMRINPVESFTDRSDYTRQTRYTELAIVKHASSDARDVEFINSLWKITPVPDDMLAMLEVCGMAGLASAARIDSRPLAMGGRLVIINGDWRTIFDEPLNGLVETYIARRERYGNIFHHAGVSGPGALPAGRGGQWIAIAGKTVGDITWSGNSQSYVVRPPVQTGDDIHQDGEYRPTFGLQEHSLDDIVDWLSLVDAELQRNEGFSVHVALALVRSISILGLKRVRTFRLGHRLRSTALAVIDADEIISRTAYELGESLATDSALRCALSFFTRPARSRDAIVPGSIFDLRHIIRLDTGELVVDYLTIFSSIWQLFNALGNVENQTAKRRATAFEFVVSRQVSNAVPLAKLWAVNQQVRFEDGTKREIDVALIVADTLIICECKSMARRPHDDIPSPARVESRWRSLQDALLQVDSLANLLATKDLRRPGPIPREIKCIVPCVVTPSAEWVPSEDRSFWFSDEIPRFCTIGELIRLARIIGSGSPLPNRLSRQGYSSQGN